MRIYLAGPMTGIENFNHPAFDAAASFLRALGHDVKSPAEFDREDGLDASGNVSNAFLRNALRRDCEAICGADAIALLPGWERSRGVAIELALAKYLGLKIVSATSGREMEAAA
jgi:hypothetical protein